MTTRRRGSTPASRKVGASAPPREDQRRPPTPVTTQVRRTTPAGTRIRDHQDAPGRARNRVGASVIAPNALTGWLAPRTDAAVAAQGVALLVIFGLLWWPARRWELAPMWWGLLLLSLGLFGLRAVH